MLFLGIDLGTSYFKVGLFDELGALKGLGRVAVPRTAPQPGRSELAVEAFWKTLRTALGEALTQANATVRDITAVSYSSQASTFLLLDERAEPLTPLILWPDLRGAPVPSDLSAFARTEPFRRTIGFAGLSEQSAPVKWRWFQQQAASLWARTARVMMIADYFTFALTGERAGDASTATFLAAYDLTQKDWWSDALRAYAIDRGKLSSPLRPGSPAGCTAASATKFLGLPAGIPFAVGALDHHAAAIGAGIERLAEISLSSGTVLAALALVDAPSPKPGCYHGVHTDGARYWRLAFDPNGAGQLETYHRERAAADRLEDLLNLAARAPRGAGAQRDDSRDHGSAVRAILERVATSHRTLVRDIASEGGAPVRNVVVTGGGARSALWLQITADVLGLPVVTPECSECACLGAAAFATTTAGVHATLADATRAMIRPKRTFEPDAESVAFYRERVG